MTTFSSSVRSICRHGSSPFIHSPVVRRLRQMTTPGGLEYLSTGLSLTALAIGFTLLGLLAFIHRRHIDLTGATGVESDCSVIGSFISIFAGAAFLIAGWAYWTRSPAFAPPGPDERYGQGRNSSGFNPLQEELFIAKGSCADHPEW